VIKRITDGPPRELPDKSSLAEVWPEVSGRETRCRSFPFRVEAVEKGQLKRKSFVLLPDKLKNSEVEEPMATFRSNAAMCLNAQTAAFFAA
jgi:hypothetical protein